MGHSQGIVRSGTGYPVRALVSVTTKGRLMAQYEFGAGQGRGIWIGKTCDVPLDVSTLWPGVSEFQLVTVDLDCLTLRLGMKGAIVQADGSVSDIEGLIGERERSLPLSDVRSLHLQCGEGDVHFEFLRQDEVVGPTAANPSVQQHGLAVLAFPEAPEIEVPHEALFRWSQADIAKAEVFPSGKTVTVGPHGADFGIPGLARKTSFATSHGVEEGAALHCRKGWRCWVKEPADKQPLDFDQLRATGRVQASAAQMGNTPDIYEIPFSQRASVVVIIGSCLFLLKKI